MIVRIKNIIVSLLFLILGGNVAFSQITDSQVFKLTQVLRNVDNYYVDSINGDDMVNKAIINTLNELDPHSSFFTKDEVGKLNRELSGSFTGIGISYNIIRDTVRIMSLIKNGPSQKAGLLSGDRIVFVEDENIAGRGITDNELGALLTGEKGTKVKLYIARQGRNNFIPYIIERDIIKINSIEAVYMITKDIGYIKLEKFSDNTEEDFMGAAKQLKLNGAEHLIIDLQSNGGGYLKSAVNVCNNFFTDNELLLYTEGVKSPKIRYFATEGEKINFNRLAIIMDEGSASASEIVAGAIQDWDRGIIVGRRSFGKGLVQRPFYLADGSMMRLTIARYYTPSGRCIQKPYGENRKDYYNDIQKRFEKGELMHADSIKYIDSLKYFTMKNKREIYAGGGITPDIFVPLDTLLYPEYYKQIASNGKLLIFIHDYVDKKREFFNTVFHDFEKFEKEYIVDDNIITKIVDYTWTEEKPKEERDIVYKAFKENELLKNHIKALIANDLWDDAEYYKIFNKNSTALLKAIDVLSDSVYYNKIISMHSIGGNK